MAVYTAIDDPSAYFQTKTYTGNGGTLAITLDGNSDLSPAFVWLKMTSHADNHSLFNTVSGVGKRLFSNLAEAEDTESTSLTAFGSDGFTLGADALANANSKTFVSWNWAGGYTASGNTGGSGTAKAYSYSASTAAGFSVVAYTGNATAGHLIPHGMGKVPRLIHIKSRADDNTWHTGSIVSASAWNDHGYLSLTNAFGTDANQFGATPDSTNFRLGTGTGTNGNNGTRIAYCFADVQGYQKIGKYVGNGNADGTFVYTGFRPAYVIQKSLTTTYGWQIYDNKRGGFNSENDELLANTSAAETDGSGNGFPDFLSNGFKLRNTDINKNASGVSYLYLAIAESPFVNSNGIPNNAR